MKKILIVNDGFLPHSWGGANTMAYLHAKELGKRGYSVSVFTTTQDSNVPTGWSAYENVRVYTFYTKYDLRWVSYRSLYNFQVIQEFRRELEKLGPDVVHFHNIHNYFSYHTIAIAKNTGAKVFLTAHDVMSFAYQKLDHFIDKNDKSIPNHFDYKISWWQNFKIEKKRFNPVRNFVIRRYLSKADKIFAVSGALRDALIQNSIKNVSIVHNGIDVESFQKPFDEKSFRENLGLSNIPVVLFMGRLTPPKGSWVLFEAMSEVTRILPGAKLLAVGTPLDEWMKNALHRLNIYDSVMLLPAVPYEEIPKYYAGADVVAVPSICLDCFPTANLEAMAAGKPVVATCFGGSREAVEDTVTGYIVNPLNTDALAQKILFLLQNPEEAKAMGGRGYSRALAHFTAGDMVETYCSYYEL